MKEIFKGYGFNLEEKVFDKLKIYYNLLIDYNAKFNITSIVEEKEVYVKHFLDSMFGQKFINKGKLIDIGSGGGFPAIPLKIINNGLSVTMVEATGKKCEFLNAVIKELKLTDICVINDRAEIIGKNIEFREKFDYCTARAVAKLNSLCEYTLPLLKLGGNFIAYKGDAEEELREAKNAIEILGGKVKEVYEFDLEGAKRTLINIEKIKNTDKKYPRGQGKERKNPL